MKDESVTVFFGIDCFDRFEKLRMEKCSTFLSTGIAIPLKSTKHDPLEVCETPSFLRRTEKVTLIDTQAQLITIQGFVTAPLSLITVGMMYKDFILCYIQS